MNKPLPTLRELFDRARDNAALIFKEDGEVQPIWHAISEDTDEPQLLICSPWGDDDDKDMAIAAIRDMFKQHHIVRFVYVSEAWAVMGANLAAVMQARPSKHPDRREMIRVSAEDRDGSALSGHYYILRPEHGPATLSPFHEDPPDMMLAGRMAGMLATVRH